MRAVCFLGTIALAATAGEADRALFRCTVTDVGSRQAAPDPELNPLHYRLITHGYVPFGRGVPGDAAPDREALLQHVVAMLGERGMVPADEAHPPRLVIGVVWGSILGRQEAKAEFLHAPVVRMKWRPQLGYEAPYDAEWHEMPADLKRGVGATLVDAVYVLSITAYDYGNASRGVEVPFWQVRAMAKASGQFAAPVLHGLIDASGPLLRTDATLPLSQEFDAADWDGEDSPLLSTAALRALVVHDHGSARFD